MMTLNSFLFVV